ncbi:unnamed protein product [Protopolystoma xenopodis]|uniref:Uncharacterized protein n=1 Tax=Protopolystoma xenopodis TaxID=117903 RepID=A0A448XI62_9PLAT|nr:unnamed protein product [Protopolystoma xenopodis]
MLYEEAARSCGKKVRRGLSLETWQSECAEKEEPITSTKQHFLPSLKPRQAPDDPDRLGPQTSDLLDNQLPELRPQRQHMGGFFVRIVPRPTWIPPADWSRLIGRKRRQAIYFGPRRHVNELTKNCSHLQSAELSILQTNRISTHLDLAHVICHGNINDHHLRVNSLKKLN